MTHYHAVVWLDHQKAKIIHFNADQAEAEKVAAHGPNHLIHNQHHEHQAGFRDGRKTPVDRHYYEAIVAALSDAKAWLVVGPGGAKQEFAKHVAEHAPGLKDRMVGVETADHPSDAQVVDHARRFFKAADRMRSQSA
ncbi:MAG: translational machinery protein [Alphaproteobacteria bacterium]|nr:translational machinery protein [Alphaproteobacteria bacterium]